MTRNSPTADPLYREWVADNAVLMTKEEYEEYTASEDEDFDPDAAYEFWLETRYDYDHEGFERWEASLGVVPFHIAFENAKGRTSHIKETIK